MDKKSDVKPDQLERYHTHAKLIQALAEQKFDTENVPSDPSPEGDGEVVQGGPKTQEMPPEEVPEKKLLDEVDVSLELNNSNRRALQNIVLAHKNAFGLDGRLGTYDAKVEINLRPGVKEISLPPFNASPAKREVIDKQWIRGSVSESLNCPKAHGVFLL